MPRRAARLTLVASLTCALLSACAGGEDPPGTTVDAADDGSTGRGHSGVGIDTDVPDTDDDTGAPDVGVDTDDVGGGGDGGEPDAADAGGDGGAGACGDGALDEGEACDDGNTVAGDGCAPDCTLETGALCDPCVGDEDCGGGDDLCVTDESGSFCGTDCRFDPCPEGYVCSVIEDGADVLGRQCRPSGGTCEGCSDADGDGVCDADDMCNGGDDTVNTDGDAVPDDCDPCPLDAPDDSDGDLVCDSDDACAGFPDDADADGDGTPDGCDAEACDDGADNDGDGAADCADTDCAGDAACVVVPEVCDDGVDNDGDGDTDCADADCAGDAACVAPPEVCDDGADNDGDGDTDCADADCAGDAACVVVPEVCDDDADNDGDGDTDCADADCAADPACLPPREICDDSIDNDGDFDVDCADADCLTDPACAVPPEVCDDGVDNDVDGDIDCADADCVSDPACAVPPEVCDDGVDNDGDGDIDCADLDCASLPACAVTPGDSCDAPLAITDVGAISGTTLGFANDYGASCSGAGGADVVYTLVPAVNATLCLSTAGSAFDTVLSVRSICDDPLAEFACNEDANLTLQSEVEIEVTGGVTYYVIVDGFSLSAAGDYVLDVAAGPCGGAEICDDGVDNDGDGQIDCRDVDCAGDPACIVPAEVCDDGIDNDGDGDIDCADLDCDAEPVCFVPDEVCNDGVDNDGDGDIDCVDLDCAGDPACIVVPEICDDGVDNDGDRAIDCADVDCAGAPTCGGTAGDTCAAPYAAAGYGLYSGDTSVLTDNYVGSCSGNAAPDAVYAFVAPDTGSVCASLIGSSFDTTMYVQTTCGDPATDLGCNDDASGLQSEVTFSTVAGQTYYVIVDGFGANSGLYDLTLYSGTCSGVLPTPGSCGEATAITPGVYSGSTSGGSDDTAPSCTSGGSPERIYAWTPSASGTACASLEGSSFDTALYVQTSCGNGGTEVVCNDDTFGLQSQVEWATAAGTTYYVVVDGYSGASGAFQLALSDTGCDGTAPFNVEPGDTCGDAGVINAFGTYTGDTSTFVNDYDASCPGGSGPDGVYTFIAPTTGTVCVNTNGSTFDTVLSVGTSCFADDLGCDDDGGFGTQSQLQFEATAGVNYTIVIDGYGSASSGATVLNVSSGACP